MNMHMKCIFMKCLTMHKFPLLSGILSDLEPMFGLQPTTWELQTRLSIYSEDMEENNQHVLFKLHRSIESIQTWYCTVNEQRWGLKNYVFWESSPKVLPIHMRINYRTFHWELDVLLSRRSNFFSRQFLLDLESLGFGGRDVRWKHL